MRLPPWGAWRIAKTIRTTMINSSDRVTRMQISKPVIAAVSGPAVAGGLELALWCDLRVADSTAYFGCAEASGPQPLR
jgi:1,4-dihydroxy-2-naphthoyl-CoA synthase